MRQIPETSSMMPSSPSQSQNASHSQPASLYAVPTHMLSKKSIISFHPTMIRKNQSSPLFSSATSPSTTTTSTTSAPRRSSKLDILLDDPANIKPWSPPTNPLLAKEEEERTLYDHLSPPRKQLPSRKSNPKFLPKSDSTGNIRSRRHGGPVKPRKVLLRKLSSNSATDQTTAVRSLADVHPNEFLWKFLQAKKLNPRKVSYREMKGYFLELTNERVAGYDMELVRAVRNEDMEMLEEMSHDRNLECCNKFGESIVHTVCRRCSVDMLEFLLRKNVDIRVACEMGRNPLHDTCWTTEINFDVVKKLLEVCPDFLYICDNRNLTPLSYISSKGQWLEWNNFLLKNQHLLLPKHIRFESLHATS